MIKTLKITSIVAAVICAVLVVLIVGFGLKGDPKIEKILASPSVIQEIKKLLGKTPAASDLVSPLVKEAKAFALRIDPPPPPVSKTATPKRTASQPQTRKTSPIPQPKAPIASSGKFELIATCRYENNPHKSLALINLPAKGNQWFRVGENVEHLVIEEILDGSIVFNQNGKESSVLMKQIPTKIRSLLAGDAGVETPQTGSFGPARGPQRNLGVGNAYRAPEGGTRKARTYIPPGSKNTGSAVFKPSGSTTTRKPRTYTPPAIPRSRKTPPKPTVQQEKEKLDKDITEIRQILKNPNPSANEKELKEEQDILAKVLELLENERKDAVNTPKKDVKESGKNKVTE